MNLLPLNRIVSFRSFRAISPFLFGLFVLSFTSTPLLAEEESAQIHGYGVKMCDHYIAVYASQELGQEEAIAEYIRYRGWLAGLVTGLSLATATDVLHGVDLNGSMRRIQLYCEGHPTEDFFTASMDLVRTLSTLR